MRFATYLTIVFAVLNFVNALLLFPQFDNDDRERLVARNYGFPLFWYRKPIYNDNITGGQVLDRRRRSSTMSYINVGHSFYGPWDITVKRNGDYIDYNDYDVHLEWQFRPNSPELPYDDVSIANGYIDAFAFGLR
ncbi:hypothetical protein ALC56_13372 [Trachymyrmex septentrionalis]|uniref:Uncharacterized protein n=1 Tax=Trachymyrmex septentrionalis TaxID=34720 RepID=A0A195EXA7_9HYME|nr:hypothetical protein ALC56_13372 [Trachymyrmex septentrionalis]